MGAGCCPVNRMLQVCVLVALALAGARAGLPTGCRLADIPVQQRLDEHKVAGLWFEKKFWYSTRYQSPPHYEDFAIAIHPGGYGPYGYGYDKGLFVVERVRKDGHCETQNEGFRKQVHPSKYKYDKREIGKKDIDWWIVETDYHNYLIEFTCLKEYPHGICALPELVLYYRNKAEESARKGIHRIRELIDHLCVDPHVYFENSQKEPGCVQRQKYVLTDHASYPHRPYGYFDKGPPQKDGKYPDKYPYGPGKYDVKHDPKDGKYGYGYGYGRAGYAYGGYGQGYGNYGYDYLYKEKKANLDAETHYYITAEHTEKLRQEKLKLEIHLLKSGRFPVYHSRSDK